MSTADLFRRPAGAMPSVQVESWICDRLRKDLFAGLTTPAERRERLRREILDRDMAMAIAGKRKGQPCETWRELFERLYGVDLETGEPTERQHARIAGAA